MAFTDLITGLAFVNAHVGFYRLDKELRENINIPIEKLQAHVQLLARSAEAVTISNQIQQLKGQANKFLKQQLNAQHAQLMVQVGQLQLQLQQLQVEKQRLELEVKKEQRLAQENQILRIFVDFYDQAQTYRQQGQLLDYLVVVFATFRIYRQIYSDLDDANNRLRISELKEKLFQGLRDIMESPQSRQSLVASYTTALQVPIALVQKGHQSSANAAEAINEVSQLRQLPPGGNWSDSLSAADSCLTHLEVAKDALVASRTEYTAFTQGLDLREFFFPTYGDNINALVSGMAEAWAEWLSSVEINAGNRLTQLYSSLQEDPPRFEQQEKEVATTIEEAKQLRLTHQLGQATVHLAQITPVYLIRFQEINQHFKAIAIPATGDEPGQVLDACLALQQLKIALSSEFASFQEFVKTNSRANERKYLQLATPRMQEINATEDTMPLSQIANAFTLHHDTDKLSTEITKALKICKNLLDKAVESDDLFEKHQQHVREILQESEVQEIETQTASYQPGAVGQILSSVRGDKGKETDRRRRLIDNLLEMYAKVHPLPVAQLPDVTDAPSFPALTPGRKMSTRTSASSDQKPQNKKLSRRLVIIGGLAILIGCVCFLLLVISRPSLQPTKTPLAAGTQTAEVVGLVNTSEPTDAAQPTNTPKPIDTPVNTPVPTATPTSTNTPEPTATPKPTDTPEPSPTPEPTASKEDYIKSANQKLTYEEVNKSDRHVGERVCWKGKVFNIQEEAGKTAFQVWYFTGRHLEESGDAFVVLYEDILPDVYEKTEVFVCGEIGEKIEGTNALGGVVRQPSILAKFVELWEPEPLPTPKPTPTSAPLSKDNSIGVQKQVGQWGLALYQVKRAKTVYFFDKGTVANGVWLMPFVEFTNNGSGTRAPGDDLDFYLQDDQGRVTALGLNDATLGAAWQFQAGHYYDDINPGLRLGVALPADVPEDMGDVWLRVEQDPAFAIYLGKAADVPLEP